MKTMLISIVCLLVLIPKSSAMTTDPAAVRSTKIEANRKEVLNAINTCRRNVKPTASNMAEAVWSSEAEKIASTYAHKCVLEHSKAAQRRLASGMDCGENLFFASYPATWTFGINKFCNESEFFIYGEGPTSSEKATGHYTQTVWYSSYLVGCDVAYCPGAEFEFFFVCVHCPVGNIMSSIKTPYEEGKPCAKCPKNCNKGLCTNPCPYNQEASNCKDFKSWCPSNSYVKDNCPRTCGCTKGEIV
ncbi:cysteine-rich venom protein-like isoform 1-T2 [Mantella aurantiaca]